MRPLNHLGVIFLLFTFFPLPAQSKSEEIVRHRNAPFVKVTFDNVIMLSSMEQRQITQKLREWCGPDLQDEKMVANLEGWASELVREAYLDRGYWKVEVTAEVTANKHIKPPQLDVAIKVLNTGPQYLLRDVRLTGVTIFSEEQLISLLPIHAGQVFSRDRVREGLEMIRNFYGSKGYIDYTSIPETKLDEVSHSITLHIEVDEGRQCHFGELLVTGLDEGLKQRIVSRWEPLRGQPYSEQEAQDFFNKIFRTVPRGISPYEYTRRERGREPYTMNFVISFVPQLPRPDSHEFQSRAQADSKPRN